MILRQDLCLCYLKKLNQAHLKNNNETINIHVGIVNLVNFIVVSLANTNTIKFFQSFYM